MGLGDDVPENFTNFLPHIHQGNDITEAPKTFVVRCEQRDVEPNREYSSFSTGFSFALGSTGFVCWNIEMINGAGGYHVLPLGWSLPQVILEENDIEELYLSQDLNALPAMLAKRKLPSIPTAILAVLSQVASLRIGPCPENLGQKEDHGHAEDPPIAFSTTPIGVEFNASEAGTKTPIMQTARGIDVTLSAVGSAADHFEVTANHATNCFGWNLHEASGAPGGALSVQFSAPVREVRNLPLILNSATGGDLNIEWFDGATSLGSMIVSAQPQSIGPYADAKTNLIPGVAFDRFTIVSADPAVEFGIGNFQFSATDIPSGDLNFDGVIDFADAYLFAGVYTGSGGKLPFWAPEADLDGDGDADMDDYSLLEPQLTGTLPDCFIAIQSASLRLEPLRVGETANLMVDALDLKGGALSYSWSSDVGSFDDSTIANPVWTAPADRPDMPVEIIVTVTGMGGCTRTVQLSQPVLDSEFAEWFVSCFPDGDPNSGILEDPDHDELTNLEEFAFDSDPKSAGDSEAPLTAEFEAGTGRLVVTHLRRTSTSAVSYRLLFSDNLDEWHPINAWEQLTPTAVRDGLERARFRAPVDFGDSGSAFFTVEVETQ